MDQIRIGRFIVTLRKEQNMTQSELSEKLGVSNRGVYKWKQENQCLILELCKSYAQI